MTKFIWARWLKWGRKLRRSGATGFSLLEITMVLGVTGVVGSMAMIQMGLVQSSMRGDGAMRVLMAQLKTAREMSIAQRRQMRVNFIPPNQVQIVRQDVPAGTTVLSTVFIEGGIEYGLMSGVPDTPDGFGNRAPVYFGVAQVVKFNSDGALVDQGGYPLNGTVFTAQPNQAFSFRAVTVLGGTGRIRGYRWDGAHWVLA